MPTPNHRFYEQSSSSFHDEWCSEEPEGYAMTEEEREIAENAARKEMEQADFEVADYRQRERNELVWGVGNGSNTVADEHDAMF